MSEPTEEDLQYMNHKAICAERCEYDNRAFFTSLYTNRCKKCGTPRI